MLLPAKRCTVQAKPFINPNANPPNKIARKNTAIFAHSSCVGTPLSNMINI